MNHSRPPSRHLGLLSLTALLLAPAPALAALDGDVSMLVWTPLSFLVTLVVALFVGARWQYRLLGIFSWFLFFVPVAVLLFPITHPGGPRNPVLDVIDVSVYGVGIPAIVAAYVRLCQRRGKWFVVLSLLTIMAAEAFIAWKLLHPLPAN